MCVRDYLPVVNRMLRNVCVLPADEDKLCGSCRPGKVCCLEKWTEVHSANILNSIFAKARNGRHPHLAFRRSLAWVA